MSLSTDISLPREYKPEFPRRCVYSGEPDPDSYVSIWAHTIGLETFLTLSPKGWQSIQAPIKKKYKIRFWCQVYGRWIVSAVIIIPLVLVIYPLVRSLGIFSKYVAVLLVLLAASPYFFWEVFFPQAFDVTIYSDKIDYEFESREYAEEFAFLNSSHIL